MLDEAPHVLLPSIPDAPEGVYADWVVYVLAALRSLSASERFALLVDATETMLELTFGDGLDPDAADVLAGDLFEAFELLTVVHDRH